MTLLTKYVDVVRMSFAGGAAAVAYATLNHSLGDTPDFVLPIPVSIGNASCAPRLLAVGGNASIATVGKSAATLAAGSSPVIVYDAVCWLVHSLIR